MSKDILGAADAILQRNATQPEAFGADGELQKGLRSGALGIGSQLASMGGAVAGELGADGASRGLYDKSTELRMRAAETAPRVQSIDQVGSLRDGMDFVAGTVGQALPSAVPAIAAGVATRNAGLTTRMLAPAATFAPMEMGDVVQRQQDAGQEVNLRDAALIGGGSAALQGVVPGVVGAKLAGRAGAMTASGGLRSTLAKNVAGTGLVESATEAGGEAFKQAALGQDLDMTAIRDNAIAGALGGAALGVPGAVGDVISRSGGAARTAVQGMSEKVKSAPEALKTAAADLGTKAVSSARRVAENVATGGSDALAAGKAALDETDLAGVAQNVKNVSSDAGQTVLDALAGLKNKAASAAERMTQGKPLEDDPVLTEGDPASPEFQARMQEMDKGHMAKAKEFADDLLTQADAWLTPERRAQLTEAAGNLGDAANRATVAGMQKAREGYDRASTMLRSAADDMRAWAEARLPTADENAKQSKVMSGLGRQIDESVVSRALSNHGVEVDPEVRLAFSSALADTVRAMTIGERVPARTVSMLDDALGEHSSAVMEQVFRATFPGATLQQRDAFYKGLNKVLDTRDSYTRVIDRMTNALQPEQAKSVTTSDMRALYRAVREWDARPDRGTAEDRYRSRQIVEGMREYFGEKTDSVLEDIRKSRQKEERAMDKGEVERDDEGNETGEDKADFGELEDDVETDDDVLHALASFEGDPDSPNQLDRPNYTNPLSRVGVSRMRFKGGKGADDRRTSPRALRTHPDKPDSDVFDTVAMTQSMHKAMPYNSFDEQSNKHRMARMFSEATTRLQEKLGRSFEVPDDRQITTGKMTWGEAKKLLAEGEGKTTLSEKATSARLEAADAAQRGEKDEARWHNDSADFYEAIAAQQRDDELGSEPGQDYSEVKAKLNDARGRYIELKRALVGETDKKARAQIEKSMAAAVKDGQRLEHQLGKLNVTGDAATYGDDARAGIDFRDSRYVDQAKTPEARHALQEARTRREDAARAKPGDMGTGATEVDPYGQVHTAVAAYGKTSLNEDRTYNNEVPDSEFHRTKPSAKRSREGMLGRLSSKIGQMENATYTREDKTFVNKPAQALGAKARELFGKFDQLKPLDQAALLSIVQADKPSDAAGTINALTAKYANKPAKNLGARVDAIASKESWDVLDTPEKAAKFIEAAVPRMRELSEMDDMTDVQRQAYAGLLGVLGRNADPHMLVTEADGFYELSKQAQDSLLARVDAATAAPEVAAKSPKAQAARLEARARSGDAALIKEIDAMQDAKSLQRALDHLNAAGVQGEATDALNARIGKLAQDPDVAYNLQTPAGSAVPAQTRMDVQRYIEKVLGPKINVAWKVMGHEGEYTAHDDTIRVAVHSMNPMGTAFHESFHAWVKRLGDHGAQDIANTIMRAASSDHVIAQLRDRLKGEPAALAQLKDAEERAAYMYQFWASDPTFRVAAGARTAFDKLGQFFRKVLGIVSNDERALHIIDAFNAGEYAKDNYAFIDTMNAYGRNAALEKIKAFVKPLTDLGERLVGAGSENLRDTGIPALRDLANAMKLKQTISGDATDAGFIPESRRMRTEFLNQLSAGLKGMSPENMDAALQELQGGAKATDVKARTAVKVTRKVLDGMLQYMQDAGVRIESIGAGVDYFPRVYDVNYIGSNRDAFRAVLTKHGVSNPDRIVSNLITAQGNEFTIESMKPGMQFAKERALKNIPDSELAPFMVKDYSRIMASYINQATRRAEWARRFGDDGARITELLAQAKEQGADAGQLRHAAEFVQGVDGTLGDGLDPRARKLMGNLIVYQNIRLLPLAIFSSVVDPMGIAVRGGTMRDAFDAFKRGVKEIPNSFRDEAKITSDLATDLAETLGTVESATLNRVVGEMYTESMTSDWARKVNDKFFKYNMMEGWNRSMRVAATQAAIKFIARHADGTADAHSKRWIAELGLEPGNVPMRNGELDITDPSVKSAVHRWVDGAVLRPNAADKPVWMNDPHFALISHLKQFVYAFNETILKRVVHEAKFGNYDAALALASYVPVMIAADAAKGLIMGGGEEPEWKKGWTFGDYLGNGVQRAGLFGVGQFGLDVQERGLGALTGPTIEQLSDAVGVMGGREAFGKFALDAMPAHALYGAAFGGS